MGSFGSKSKSNRTSNKINRKSGVSTNSGPSSTRTNEITVKILVIGDVGIGKTR